MRNNFETEAKMALSVVECVEKICDRIPGDYSAKMRETLDRKLEKVAEEVRQEIIAPFMKFAEEFTKNGPVLNDD